jgi:hypothetical protein
MGDPAAEDMKFCAWAGFGCKSVYDGGPGIGGGGELIYESYDSGVQSTNLAFCGVVYSSYNVRWSINCHGSHDLLGCYGLRNKEYCILNKQYTKDEYETLVPRILEQMSSKLYVDAKGRSYGPGEFFPVEISPFAYNETIAEDYFPLSKERATELGFPWRDAEARDYHVTKPASELPDNIEDVPDSIVNEVIGCAHEGRCEHQCVKAFRIIPEELKLLKRLGLPFPRLCFNCRHRERLAERNPMKLWHRQCMCDKPNHTHHGHCLNEFETSYAPDRKEIVYCEQCYQAEVM